MLKFFRNPFAILGNRTAVDNSDPGSGVVNYETGYTPPYQLPKTDPASRNIERDKLNQVLFDITAALQELQAHGTPDFITSTLNGGSAFSYSLGDRVRYDAGTGTRVYVSRKDANTSLPSVTADWALESGGTPAATAGGTANAITASFTPALGPLVNGRIITVEHTAANTGAATLNVDGLGAIAINKDNSQPLQAGDISGANFWGVYIYDSSLNRWVMLNPSTSGFFKANQVLIAAAGAQRLPGGYILQMGTTSVATSATVTVTLPFAFPAQFSTVVATADDVTANLVNNPFFAAQRSTLGSFTLRSYYSASELRANWFAVGF